MVRLRGEGKQRGKSSFPLKAELLSLLKHIMQQYFGFLPSGPARLTAQPQTKANIQP